MGYEWNDHIQWELLYILFNAQQNSVPHSPVCKNIVSCSRYLFIRLQLSQHRSNLRIKAVQSRESRNLPSCATRTSSLEWTCVTWAWKVLFLSVNGSPWTISSVASPSVLWEELVGGMSGFQVKSKSACLLLEVVSSGGLNRASYVVWSAWCGIG